MMAEALCKGGAGAAALITFSTALAGTGAAWTFGCFALFVVLVVAGFSLEGRRRDREAHRALRLAARRRGRDW